MDSFLEQVVEYYYTNNEISNRVFVFPNKRAIVFFNKYLHKKKKLDGSPILAPRLTTINDLISSESKTVVAPKIRLIVELYRCYKKLNKNAERLDEFFFWGDVILNDFNDVDKYLVDAKQLFTNISDLKSIQDDYSYLSETQAKAIEQFITHCKIESSKKDSSSIQESFLQIWNILHQLYVDFNKSLREKGIAYEGMVYREVAQKEILDAEGQYVFVGLNALNECEKGILRKLRDAGRAEFFWDYSSDMIKDENNKSSFFLKDNIKEFPQLSLLDQKETLKVPNFHLIQVPSAIGQVKQLSYILKSVSPSGDLKNLDCEQTAIVLPDESLLTPVLNSIDDQIADINITMGSPMKDSNLYIFMKTISQMQLNLYEKDGKIYFYHRYIRAICSNNIYRCLTGDNHSNDILTENKRNYSEKAYYSQEELRENELMRLIFLKSDSIIDYLMGILAYIGKNLEKESTDLNFTLEYYKSLMALKDMSEHFEEFGIEQLTLIKLINQLVVGITVPFEGEPLKGLQVMGPLETRSLDFKNLIIFSANEGIFPHRSVSSSFIPPELRKGFSLPTYEYQDAVWAYYFYRMIQRAENVWMLCDTRTEGVNTGEESRYIKQLEYNFNIHINRYIPQDKGPISFESKTIEKSDEDVKMIKSFVHSASSIQTYLQCPLKYYYSYIKKLKEVEEASENLDSGMIGNVLHGTMESLYTKDLFSGESISQIDGGYIEKLLTESGRKRIKAKVNNLICEALNAFEVRGRNIVTANVLYEYIIKILKYDQALIQEKGDTIKILGLELKFDNVLFNGYKFKGFIDRLDAVGDCLRVVDYKTGKVDDSEQNVMKDKEKVVERLFAQDISDRPKIALQFFIYNMLLRHSVGITTDKNAVSANECGGSRGNRSWEAYDVTKTENAVYAIPKMFSTNKLLPSYMMEEDYYEAISTGLYECLEEMTNKESAWRMTNIGSNCKYCPFKTICGRI